MTLLTLRVEDQRLLLGAAAGLGQATALITIAVAGDIDAGAFARIHAGAAGLIPEQPLFGVGESDWPAVFLVDSPAGGGEPHWRLGEWVVALTVALQRWARDPVWRGQVIAADSGGMRLAIPWQREGVLTDTLRLALQLIELWAGSPADQLPDVNAAIRQGMEAAQAGGWQPNAVRFALAAHQRGIPVDPRPGHVQFGWGQSRRKLYSTFTDRTCFIATMIAQDKIQSVRMLHEAGVPVPAGELVADFDRALLAAHELGWPVVVKPVNQEQGRGVVTGIRDETALRRAFDGAAEFSPGNVVVERHVDGDDYRLLVVHGRVLAVTRRVAGGVTGDGVSTVEELLDRLNADPRRGRAFTSLLKTIDLDAEALSCLADHGLGAQSIPAAQRWIPLRHTANVSKGGTAEDVTALTHPDNLRLAERAARLIGLDIAGIDLLTTDITRSWREIGAHICEVNAQPGLRVHWLAEPDRDINGEIMDLVFGGESARIPTAAIVGDDADAVAQLLAHIWTTAGKITGVCTTEVLRIGDDVVSTEDMTGFIGTRIVLNDPSVQAGVFVLPAAKVAEFGHPCDRYDVVAVMSAGDRAEAAELVERAGDAVVFAADGSGGGVLISRTGGEQNMLMDTETLQIPTEHARAVGLRVATFAVALARAQGIDPATIRTALAAGRW